MKRATSNSHKSKSNMRESVSLKLDLGHIRETLPVYGVITSNAEQVQSVSARFEGVIRSVNKKIGDHVRKR